MPRVVIWQPKPPPTEDLVLRTPQARVLAALMPKYPDDPTSEWPTVTRAMLGIKAGYTALSGSVTRVLNGIYENSSSGEAHPGLLKRGMIEEVILDIDGVKELNYRITSLGIRAYCAYIDRYGLLPKHRDKSLSVNDRFKKKMKDITCN